MAVLHARTVAPFAPPRDDALTRPRRAVTKLQAAWNKAMDLADA